MGIEVYTSGDVISIINKMCVDYATGKYFLAYLFVDRLTYSKIRHLSSTMSETITYPNFYKHPLGSLEIIVSPEQVKTPKDQFIKILPKIDEDFTANCNAANEINLEVNKGNF